MLTGRYPTVLSVSWFDQKINRNFKVLPAQLANIGFRTSLFSNFKVLLNERGFSSHFDEIHKVNVDQNAFDAFGRWLDGHDNAFLFFHIGEYVHEPYFAPDHLVRRFVEDRCSSKQIDKNELLRVLTDRETTGNVLRKTIGNVNKGLQSLSKAEIDYLFARYDAGIYYIDEIVAKFYDMLKTSGDDYLFVLTADHGQAFMEHGYFGHGLSLYNEVIKVPLIIDYGQRYQGRLDTGLQLMDLYPTILECLGVESDADADIDGVSFWDGLSGNDLPERTILTEGFPNISIIEGRHKLISAYSRHWNIKTVYRQFMQHGKTASWLRFWYSYLQRFQRAKLFDLQTDPDERNNLVRIQKDVYRRLHRTLGEVMQLLLQKSLPAEDVYLDKEIEDQLAKLGYL
jgi:arylsulfatase A-like enzyme